MFADPSAPVWTIADVAAALHVSESQARRSFRVWEAEGFPRPLPYGTRRKLWRPAAVLDWMRRHETRQRARSPQLSIV